MHRRDVPPDGGRHFGIVRFRDRLDAIGNLRDLSLNGVPMIEQVMEHVPVLHELGIAPRTAPASSSPPAKPPTGPGACERLPLLHFLKLLGELVDLVLIGLLGRLGFDEVGHQPMVLHLILCGASSDLPTTASSHSGCLCVGHGHKSTRQ